MFRRPDTALWVPSIRLRKKFKQSTWFCLGPGKEVLTITVVPICRPRDIIESFACQLIVALPLLYVAEKSWCWTGQCVKVSAKHKVANPVLPQRYGRVHDTWTAHRKRLQVGCKAGFPCSFLGRSQAAGSGGMQTVWTVRFRRMDCLGKLGIEVG
jgi:hypothetical protein